MLKTFQIKMTFWLGARINFVTAQNQPRLQDLGAPVRLIKGGLNLCSNLITSKIKSYVYIIA